MLWSSPNHQLSAQSEYRAKYHFCGRRKALGDQRPCESFSSRSEAINKREYKQASQEKLMKEWAIVIKNHLRVLFRNKQKG